MEERILLVDIDRCIRCYSCQVACKQEHDLPIGQQWTKIVTVEPRLLEGELHTDFVFTSCVHCFEPTCALVCPVEAIYKREDGVVLIDPEKCTGCEFCVAACPYGAVQVLSDKKVAWKCDFCYERTDSGIEPSCVQHCAGGSLQWVTPNELLDLTARKHKARTGRVCYVSEKWKLMS
jgi:Fe-S-cluster-containing dehydrogenase component